jgi:hypothetical protein
MKKVLFAFALMTVLGFTNTLTGQQKLQIETILENPGKYENELVTVDGIVTQYFQGNTQTTSYFLIQSNYGGVMNVNTSDAPPVIFKKYEITGTVVMDQVQRRPVLIEKSRHMLDKGSSLIYYLAAAVLILIIFLVIYLLKNRTSVEKAPSYSNDSKASFDSSDGQNDDSDYSTIRISKDSPRTVKLIPGKLEIISGADKGKTLQIAGYPTTNGILVTIGREVVEGDRKNSHIQLLEKTVSRQQAELIFINGKLLVKNLSHTNNTQVDGKLLEVDETFEVGSGSVIKTGEVEFMYKK